MITGIGVDLVDISRFERSLARTPGLRERVFSPAERALPVRALAERFAAKEALTKALGGADGLRWNEIEVSPAECGRSSVALVGSTATAVRRRGITAIHLSITREAGFAIAYVVAEEADLSVPGQHAPPTTHGTR